MADSLRSTVLYIGLGIVLAFAINQGLGLALSTDTPIVAVESNSMAGSKADSFERGALLLIRGQSEYAVGDIIVFTVPGQSTPIVHRVVAINADRSYQTKGDANSAQLPPETHILHSQIHGKVIGILPYLGYVKIIATEVVVPNIFLVIAAIAVLAVSMFAIERFGQEKPD